MNRIIVFLRKRTRVLAIATLAIGVTAANAQLPVGPHRPAGVPDGYLITPFGYFHPSCVRQLAKDETVLKDEHAIRHADGTFENIQSCGYPRYGADGKLIAEDAGKVAKDARKAVDPSISHSWIEAGSVTTGLTFGELSSTWVVPPAPTSDDGQIIYLFPGLEDANDVVSILQPVLGWNAYYAGEWGIASWNCCVVNTVHYSTPVGVASGDTILGTIKDTCSAGTQACATWNVTTEDVTQGHTTTLVDTSSNGQTFNWAFSGALEVYNIAQCSDYPLGGAITFTNVGLYDWSFDRIPNPEWGMLYWSAGLTPQCNYGGQTSSNALTLDYGTTIEPAQSPTNCGYIYPGQGLRPGQNWESCNSSYNLRMQTDGNLVLYEGTRALWATNTYGKIASEVIMQTDGNLVLYNSSDGPIWASGTDGNTGAYLRVQNDGNLVVYSNSGRALWASNTDQD
jgi:hypothetical protein